MSNADPVGYFQQQSETFIKASVKSHVRKLPHQSQRHLCVRLRQLAEKALCVTASFVTKQ